MKVYKDAGKLPGLQEVDVRLCEGCTYKKKSWVFFQLTKVAEEIDARTHAFGCVKIKSYLVKIVTFYIHHICWSLHKKVHVLFLHHLSEVFDAFRTRKASVKNENA